METKEMKVSAQTQKFVECMRSLDKHWSQVHDTLASFYGNAQASSILEDGYSDAHEKLRGIIAGYLFDSMNERMANIDFQEI